jgi:hypothetical protein
MPNSVAATFLFTVSLGPYEFAVTLCPKSSLTRRNVTSETDYNEGVIRISSHLQGRKLVTAFVTRLVFAIHYTHGADDSCPEEHFTHSFATGLLEFIRRNPEAWHWLNTMFSRYFSKGQKFERLCDKLPAVVPRPPVRMAIGNRVVTLSAMPHKVAERERVFGYYFLADHRLKVHESLKGEHLAVIFWHELTHGFHHWLGLEDGATEKEFLKGQVTAWLDFVRDNPSAWKWFICLATHSGVRLAAPEAA